MSLRQALIICLVLLTILIPLTELSLGFTYINTIEACPVQHDIMLLMSIGGVFQAIFFAAASAFVFTITPARFKIEKNLSAAQISAKGSNRGIQILIGCITFIFTVCALTFFVLLQIRVFGNYKTVQTKFPTQPKYCSSTIYYSAFGLIIALYVDFFVLLIIAALKLFGIGLDKEPSTS